MNNNKTKNRRRLPGSRSYRDYSQDMLKLAVEMVAKNKMSSREAEKRFGIPRRTILNKIKKVHNKTVGGQQKLTNDEEEKFVNVLIASADYGSPMTKMDIKMLVFKYLEKNSRTDLFNGKLPSDTWINGFLNRHRRKLTFRTTQNIKKVRAEQGLEKMKMFFDNLLDTLKDVPPTNILNYDETNLSDNPGTSKFVFRKGVKHPERILNTTKSCISIMFTASAAGACLPVYVVYKSTNLYSEWLEGGPNGARYNCSKSGWFDTASFEDYFKTIVIEWAKHISGPKVVIGDNLSSHINIEVIELCQKYNIRFVFLPPNSTHLTQPLDVAYFGPLKREWKKILLDYKLKNPGQTTLNKKHFPKLLDQLLKNMKHKETNNIINGFKATGIWPVNPRKVFERIPEYLEDLHYGIDATLLEYLQETRAPKPMIIKRNKKLRTEPGKSVSVEDILRKIKNPLKGKKKFSRNDISEKAMEGRKSIDQTTDMTKEYETDDNRIHSTNTDVDILDEVTGTMTRKEAIHQDENDISVSTGKNSYGKVASQLLLSPVTNNPDKLGTLCLNLINEYLNSISYFTGAQSSDVCLLHPRLKQYSANQSFVATDENDLPMCLRPNTSSSFKPQIISNIKITTDNMNVIRNNLKQLSYNTETTRSALQMKIVRKKLLKENILSNTKKTDTYDKTLSISSRKTKIKQGKLGKCNKKNMNIKTGEKVKKSIKRKKSKSYSETSTENSDTLSLSLTDNSEHETFDEYVETCLKQLEEKENLEPDNAPVLFGLSDISYYSKNENLKKDNWVVVKFATKKSLKHYVGRILYVKSGIPTVKFVRIVKNIKSCKEVFIYPNVEDVCEVNCDDIEIYLPQPNICRRGQLMFPVKIDSFYNIQ